MCRIAGTDADIVAIRDACMRLRLATDPDPLRESSVEYEIKKADLGEAELAEFGICPVDLVEDAALVVSAAGG